MLRLIVDECGEPELTEPKGMRALYVYRSQTKAELVETDRYTLPKWNALADPAMRTRRLVYASIMCLDSHFVAGSLAKDCNLSAEQYGHCLISINRPPTECG